MSTGAHFLTRRLRWRLIGAWRWPLFFVFTIADGLIIHALPPNGAEVRVVPALIIAAFGNLILIGAIAPWLARRLAARHGEPPPPAEFPPAHHGELRVDRIATVLLVVAMLGVVVAGLGNQKVVIAATDAQGRAASAARAYVMAHAPAEVRRNFDGSANTIVLSDQTHYYRICGSYNDPRRAYCMYVDAANRHHTTVRYDHDTEPNGQLFPNSQSLQGG